MCRLLQKAYKLNLDCSVGDLLFKHLNRDFFISLRSFHTYLQQKLYRVYCESKVTFLTKNETLDILDSRNKSI